MIGIRAGVTDRYGDICDEEMEKRVARGYPLGVTLASVMCQSWSVCLVWSWLHLLWLEWYDAT